MKTNVKGYLYFDSEIKTEKDEIQDAAWISVFRCLYVVIAIFTVAVLVFCLFFKVVKVDGVSMFPTLNDSDNLLVSTINYTPEAGDIVVIGVNNKNLEPIVKRVIATQNQTISIDYRAGKVFVDGEEIEEAYISKMTKPDENELTYPYTVPAGCVFVMGDNRDESNDSRNRSIRAIDVRYIVGKAIV